MATTERPLPPQPAPDRMCVYELQPSTGWRWYPRVGWERVCDQHPHGPAARRGDYVPDTANVERQEPAGG